MIPSLTTIAAPPPTTPDAALPGNGNLHTGEVATQATTFADVLLTGLQDERPGAEAGPEIDLSAAAVPTPITLNTPQPPGADNNDNDNDNDKSDPETPWPPEGLGSLWLPTANLTPPAEPAAAITAPPSSVASADIDTQYPLHSTRPGMGLPPADSPSLAPDAERPCMEPASAANRMFSSAGEDAASTSGPDLTEQPLVQLGKTGPTFGHDADQPPAPEHATTPPLMEQALAESKPTAAHASFAEIPRNEAAPVLAPTAISPPTPAPAPAPAPVPPALPTAPFPAPDLHADNFPDTISSHIQWLAEQKIGHAHLHLNPQEMGPLEVRLKLDGEQLQAHFSSAEPEVRQALEHHLPRLRELLDAHGLNLGQADIGQQPSQQHPSPSPHTQASSSTGYTDDTSAPDTPTQHVHSAHLVDTYA